MGSALRLSTWEQDGAESEALPLLLLCSEAAVCFLSLRLPLCKIIIKVPFKVDVGSMPIFYMLESPFLYFQASL